MTGAADASRHCRVAIAAIERAIASRPADPERCLAECSGALAAARDALIERRRAAANGGDPAPDVTDPDTMRLRHVNEAISLVTSCEMPIQGTRWSRIRQAHEALRRLGRVLDA